MWNLGLYVRLDMADAWAMIGPINWYAPTSILKPMFDRLLCMNGGNPRDQRQGFAHHRGGRGHLAHSRTS